MPSGRVHDKITWTTTPAVAVASFLFTFSFVETAIITVAYLFAAMMFSGDLDLPSKQTNRWGPFQFIWKPYQSAFSHRSIFTHGIVLGTVIRVLYLFLWTWFFYAIYYLVNVYVIAMFSVPMSMGEYPSWVWNLMWENGRVSSLLLIGLLLGSASHSLADWTVTATKKSIRGFQR